MSQSILSDYGSVYKLFSHSPRHHCRHVQYKYSASGKLNTILNAFGILSSKIKRHISVKS